MIMKIAINFKLKCGTDAVWRSAVTASEIERLCEGLGVYLENIKYPGPGRKYVEITYDDHTAMTNSILAVEQYCASIGIECTVLSWINIGSEYTEPTMAALEAIANHKNLRGLNA